MTRKQPRKSYYMILIDFVLNKQERNMILASTSVLSTILHNLICSANRHHLFLSMRQPFFFSKMEFESNVLRVPYHQPINQFKRLWQTNKQRKISNRVPLALFKYKPQKIIKIKQELSVKLFYLFKLIESFQY